MMEFKPGAVRFAMEFLQRAFEDLFTVKVLREWEALAEARTGETRLRQMYYLQQYIEKTLRAAAILYSSNSRKQEGVTSSPTCCLPASEVGASRSSTLLSTAFT